MISIDFHEILIWVVCYGQTIKKFILYSNHLTIPDGDLLKTISKNIFFGESEFALNKIDVEGKTDTWRNYLTELFNSPVSNITSNGKIDIIKEFPKTDGSGFFKMGIRLSENTDGTFNLVTILTKQ